MLFRTATTICCNLSIIVFATKILLSLSSYNLVHINAVLEFFCIRSNNRFGAERSKARKKEPVQNNVVLFLLYNKQKETDIIHYCIYRHIHSTTGCAHNTLDFVLERNAGLLRESYI